MRKPCKYNIRDTLKNMTLIYNIKHAEYIAGNHFKSPMYKKNTFHCTEKEEKTKKSLNQGHTRD